MINCKRFALIKSGLFWFDLVKQKNKKTAYERDIILQIQEQKTILLMEVYHGNHDPGIQAL